MSFDDHYTLRQRLRCDTRQQHEALDDVVSAFDLASAAGLSAFLRMQNTALAALRQKGSARLCADAMADLHARTARDLTKLAAPQSPPPSEIAEMHPVALDYAISGSRLGTRVLKLRWQESRNALVQSADQYFTASPYTELWRAFCDDANARPALGAEADRIVRDANTIFTFYLSCASLAHTDPGLLDAQA